MQRKPKQPRDVYRANRLLAELASVRRMPGAHGAQNLSVFNIHEASSTGATTQSTTKVEFWKKSNKACILEVCTRIASLLELAQIARNRTRDNAIMPCCGI